MKCSSGLWALQSGVLLSLYITGLSTVRASEPSGEYDIVESTRCLSNPRRSFGGQMVVAGFPSASGISSESGYDLGANEGREGGEWEVIGEK